MPARPAVVLTREPADNAGLARALGAAGVRVREIPCVSTRLVVPGDDEISGLPDVSSVGVVAFTSSRGVRGLLEWTKMASADSWPARLRQSDVAVAAVGRRTASALEDVGWPAGIVADPPTGQQLARQIVDGGITRGDAVIPGAEIRAGGLGKGLMAAGMTVHTPTVYRNVAPLIAELEPFAVAAVFVASPSAARRLLEVNPWMADETFVAIGTTTASTLRDLGVVNVLTPGNDPSDWQAALVRAHDSA